MPDAEDGITDGRCTPASLALRATRSGSGVFGIHASSAAKILAREADTRQSRRKQREPMPVFLAKGVTFAAVIALAMIWIALHFNIGFSPQKIISLPWRAWVVHKGDRTVTRNEYVAFYTDERMSAYFPPGTHFIKRVVGMPGDHVVVKHGVVIVNDEPITKLYLAKSLDKSKADFTRDFIVDKGHYWVMGVNPFSYDSRYWGTISRHQVIGRGYPIW